MTKDSRSNNTTPTMTFKQLQSLASEAPTWHADDGSVYDPNRARAMTGRTTPPRLALGEPANNDAQMPPRRP